MVLRDTIELKVFAEDWTGPLQTLIPRQRVPIERIRLEAVWNGYLPRQDPIN